MNYKKQIKRELERETGAELSFDVSALPQSQARKNYRKKKMKRTIAFIAAGAVAATAVILPVAAILVNSISMENRFQVTKQNYDVKTLSLMQSSSFSRLNDVEYPSTEANKRLPVSEEYKRSVSSFAGAIYSAATTMDDLAENNFSFSPLGLYNNLCLLSLASDDEETLAALDGLLGGDKESRKRDFINAYQNDYYSNDLGTMQMYFGLFLTNQYKANPDFVGELADYYTEAYSLDFLNSSDLSKMLGWVDQRMGEKDFLSEEDLEIDEYSMFYLFATLYFNNRWLSAFSEQNSYRDAFYAPSGEVETKYMSHSYMGDCYDFGDYVACYDNYANGAKIKYLVPKSGVKEDIFALTEGKDILSDEEGTPIRTSDEDFEYPVVDLSVPVFESESFIDFSPVLKEMGLSYLFASDSSCFNYAFTDLGKEDRVSLAFVKQKNKVSFTETGTTIKSVTVSGAKAEAAAPIELDTIEIRLNCPFIYVIYDGDNLPVYIGGVNNPELG